MVLCGFVSYDLPRKDGVMTCLGRNETIMVVSAKVSEHTFVLGSLNI